MEVFKIDDSNYMVYCITSGRRSPCYFKIPLVRSPFGIEEFNKVSYLNLEMESKHSCLLGDIYKVEKELSEYMKNIDSTLEWVSSVKKNGTFKPLWKIRIQKRRGRVICKSSQSFYDIDFKGDIRIVVVLHSIWVYQGKCGIIYYLDEVEQICNDK
jgi:hypothetical protein